MKLKILNDLPKITELLINCQSSDLNPVLVFSLSLSPCMCVCVCVHVCVCVCVFLSLLFSFSMVMRWKQKFKIFFYASVFFTFLLMWFLKNHVLELNMVFPTEFFCWLRLLNQNICLYMSVDIHIHTQCSRTNIWFICFNPLFKALFNFWESSSERFFTFPKMTE